MTFEGRKRDAALARMVLVVEQVAGHACRLAAPGGTDIGARSGVGGGVVFSRVMGRG